MSVHICEFWYCSDHRDRTSRAHRCRKHAVGQVNVLYSYADGRDEIRHEWRCSDHWYDQDELAAECAALGIELPE